MKRNDWTVTKSSTRPAGKSDECFYCKRKIGEQHKDECVIRSRTVVMNYTIVMTVDVPESWSPEDIEFHYNEGSWCAGNILNMIQKRSDILGTDCLCGVVESTYVKEADEDDESIWGATFVNELDS